MQLDYFLSIKDDPNTLIPQMVDECRSSYEYDAFKQYYPEFHEILSKTKRPDKVIKVPDPNYTGTEPEKAPLVGKTVYLNRIALALQKLIVKRKTGFVTGGKVSLKAKAVTEQEKKLFEEVYWTWNDNKLQYKNSDVFKRMVSETECAEIWYSKKNEDKTVSLKCNIYSPSKGYKLVPVFDAHEDLIAFGLGYKEIVDSKEVECYDVYDKDEIRRYIHTDGAWIMKESTTENPNPLPNPYGKIPVIYYQSQTAWEDVQKIIERLELLISTFGDVNDYNGSPILFAKGEIQGWSSKGESGKVIQGQNDAEIKYVSWDHAPESIELEIKTLENYIYTITQTPNISFKEMQGLGANASGVAFDRIFIDAHINARDYHNGAYGEGIQRRINFIKTALSEIEPSLKQALYMEITPEFALFSIDSDYDRIDTAMKANGGRDVMSWRDSIMYTGLTDDPDKTLNEIKGQESQQQQ